MSVAQPPQPTLADRLQNAQAGTRDELEISRHVFSGRPCYVIRDPVTFASHRLSLEDYQVFTALRSDRSLGAIFSKLVDQKVIAEDQSEDFYRFIVHLNQLGLLNLPVSDGKNLYGRFVRRRSAQRKAKILGILFLRVPLVQPDEFLSRTMRWVRPLFTPTAFVLWLLCLAVSCILVGARWKEFCSPLGTVLTAQNIFLLWALLIGLKVIHELGHGYACKRFGGQVTEMGAYFILFTPCAYVDASTAWGFPNRMHRVIVSLAGVYFESMLAMLALLVWIFSGPGLLNSTAQYIVVLSTIVTIGFNINPLMKYDGYYMVSDLLGRPNLRQEATGQVRAELKHLLFGIRSPSLSATRTSRLLLAGFGFAAGAYRMLVLLGISVMLALKVPAVGLAVGAVYLTTTLWSMGSKLVRYLLTSSELAPVRRRALCVVVLLALGIVGILAFAPAPGSVNAVGTLARENDSVVHAGSSGFVSEVSVRVGQTVKRGGPLATLENIEVTSAVEKKQAEIDGLHVQLQRDISENLGAAAATQQKIGKAKREYEQLLNDQSGLQIRAPIDGCVTQDEGLRHSGRFVRKGEPLATVSAGLWIVEAVANAEDLADYAPKVGQRVQVRLVGQGSRRLTGTILRIARAGSRRIEDASLTQLAGGDIAVSADTMKANEPFFEIVVTLKQQHDPMLRHGMTAVVSFGGRRQAIGVYLYRRGLLLLNKLRLAS